MEKVPRRTLYGGRDIGAPPAHGARHLTRRTRPSALREVDLEFLLGEVGQSRPFSHLGYQCTPGDSTWLTNVAIPKGRFRDGRDHQQPDLLFTLGQELQRALGVRRIPRSTDSAMKSWRAPGRGSSATAALWPSKRWRLLLR